MPELPEVETVRRGLTPVLEGARLSGVRINRPDLRFPFPDRFVEWLEGATVERIDRRAKYLLMPLSTGETWVTHLGMTGRFTLDGRQLGEFEEAAPIAAVKTEHPAPTAHASAVIQPSGDTHIATMMIARNTTITLYSRRMKVIAPMWICSAISATRPDPAG